MSCYAPFRPIKTNCIVIFLIIISLAFKDNNMIILNKSVTTEIMCKLSFKLTCSVVRCPELAAPAHGMIHQEDRTFSANATIRCEEGFIYSRPEHTTRRCHGNMTWSGQAGSCEGESSRDTTLQYIGHTGRVFFKLKKTIEIQLFRPTEVCVK